MGSFVYLGPVLPVVAAALVVHLVFKRDETSTLSRLLGLLLGVPTCIHVLFSDKSEAIALGFLKDLAYFYSTLGLSILLYRLSPWHPIARYPGPILCKVSKLYWTAIARKGQQHRLLAKLHKQYGDIVRIGPNEVSIANASAIDPLMGAQGVPKGQSWSGRLPRNALPNLVGIRDKKEHARRRKTWQRALNPTSIKYYEGFLSSRTQQMVDLLAQKVPGPINMSEWMGYYTFDIMGDIVFGDGPEMMKNGDSNNLWHLLEESQKTLFLFGLVPWLGQLMLQVGKVIPLLPGITNYRNYTIGRVVERRQRGSPNRDLFHYLMDDDGVLEDKPTAAEVMSDSALAIIAGADTTTSGISSFLYFITRYPKVYQKVQEEVDSLGGDLTSSEKQAKLTYLNATINESLRLLPPVQSGSQREVPRGSGVVMIGPYELPEGTAAFIPFSLVQRDQRNFSPCPEMFLPERWLSKDLREKLEPDLFNEKVPYRLNQSAFLPFSYGPANCVGKQLAYVEMRMAICLLLHRFTLRFAPGYNPSQYEDEFRDYYIVVKGDLPILLTIRN